MEKKRMSSKENVAPAAFGLLAISLVGLLGMTGKVEYSQFESYMLGGFAGGSTIALHYFLKKIR